MDTIYIAINFFAFISTILLFALLFFRKNNSLPNKVLSCSMLFLGMYFLNSMIMFAREGLKGGWFFFLVQFTAVFVTSSFAIYVYSLMGKWTKTLWLLVLGSTSIGGIIVFDLFQYLSWESAEQVLFFKGLIRGPYPEMITNYSLVFYCYQQFVFCFLLWKVLKHKKEVMDTRSNLERSKIVYLQNLMTLLVVLNVFIVVLYASFDILFVEYILLPIIVAVIYGFIIYYAFNNNVVFTSEGYKRHLALAEEGEVVSSDETPSSSNSFPEELPELIRRALDKDELFKDEHLTLKKLADHVGCPSYQVSKVINSVFSKSFFEFVNEKRLEASLSLLKEIDQNKYSIEGISKEVGFNSRSAFYRAFKKRYNKTPSNYFTSPN